MTPGIITSVEPMTIPSSQMVYGLHDHCWRNYYIIVLYDYLLVSSFVVVQIVNHTVETNGARHLFSSIYLLIYHLCVFF